MEALSTKDKTGKFKLGIFAQKTLKCDPLAQIIHEIVDYIKI